MTIAKSWVSPSPFCPKRSILAGLFKFLAVGCGLNEVSPLANSSGTSHLSPDGGGITHAAVDRLAAEQGPKSVRGTRCGAVPFHKYYRWVATTCHCSPVSKVQRFKYPAKSHA